MMKAQPWSRPDITIQSPDPDHNLIAWFKSRSDCQILIKINCQIPITSQSPDTKRNPIARFWKKVIYYYQKLSDLSLMSCFLQFLTFVSSGSKGRERVSGARCDPDYLFVPMKQYSIGGWRSGPGGTRGTDQLQEWSCPKWNVRWLEMNCF